MTSGWVRGVPERQVARNSCSLSQTVASGMGLAKQMGLFALGSWLEGGWVELGSLQVILPRNRKADLPWALSLQPQPFYPPTHTYGHTFKTKPSSEAWAEKTLGGRGWAGSPLNHRQAICFYLSCQSAQGGRIVQEGERPGAQGLSVSADPMQAPSGYMA